MAMPPGAPASATETAIAGDNIYTVEVPDSQDWKLQAVSARNATKAVRINVYVRQAGNDALIATHVQTSTDDWLVQTFDNMTVLWSQTIVFEFKNCDLNDALHYNSMAQIYKRGELR